MKELQIQPQSKGTLLLSKEQKRFNKLLKDIERIKLEIEQTEHFDLWLRQEGTLQVVPHEEQNQKALRRLLEALHHTPHLRALSKSQKKAYDEIILSYAEALLESTLYEGDAEIEAIYDAHAPDHMTYAQQREEEVDEMKESLVHMMNQMFDIKIDREDMEDMEKMQEKMDAYQKKMEEEMEREKERKSSRKKTPKQAAAAEKRAAAEQAVKRSGKQMYTELVRYYHPDKEPDEQLRAEKTEIMKQITAAYEADDHLKLLQLQMTLLSREQNHFAEFNDDQLKYFNNVLKEQLQELQEQLYGSDPEVNGNMFASLAVNRDRRLTQAAINRYIKRCQAEEKTMEKQLKMIQTPIGLKTFIKENAIPEPSPIDGMPSFLQDLINMGKW